MKRSLFVLILSICCFSLYAQFDNDLELVKPTINFNHENGGYYCDYYQFETDSILFGGIIKNIGNNIAYNVYLEIAFLDYAENEVLVLHSDSITELGISQTDTFNIIKFEEIKEMDNIVFRVFSDSVDDNSVNDIDTVPGIYLWSVDWSLASRSKTETGIFNTARIDGFQSEDFLGVRFEVKQDHWFSFIEVKFLDYWPDDLSIYTQIYENGTLIYSVEAVNYHNTPPFGIETGPMFDFDVFYFPENEYYIGLQFVYPEGTDIPIAIDTSNYHNFEYESIAKVGEDWVSCDFVPLINIVCDPEGIETNNYQKNLIFPNPVNERAWFKCNDACLVELLNISGQVLDSKLFEQHENYFEMGNYKSGMYFVRFIYKDKTELHKLIKI
ncbi:MAG: hypothetical protein C0596_00860 [Marinilabiliales bacterium]|nr:MAG: hypothetical protein C0596_00860 [Marinilabiliales bacterium]